MDAKAIIEELRVIDVLAILSANQVLQELPDLDEVDLRACMVYAAQPFGGGAQ